MGNDLLDEEDEFDWDDEESKIAKYGIVIGIIASVGLLAATFIFFNFTKINTKTLKLDSIYLYFSTSHFLINYQ